jgi:uncharacterized damage-inducible protein DinB
MSMHIQTFARTLAIQFSYTSYVFNANLDGISDDQAFGQPDPGGNCANWVAGHIVQARGATVAMLGQECPFDLNKYDRYTRGSEPVSAASEGAVPLSEMVADFGATEPLLRAGLDALTGELLASDAPFSPGNDPDETVGSLLAGIVFHEAYHAGQLGVLRRLSGAEGAIA